MIEQYADAVAEFNVATYRGIDSKPSGDESLRIQKQLQTRLAAQSGQRAGMGESLADKIRAEVRLVLTDPEINLTPGAHRALRYVLSLLAAAPTPAAQGGA
ncbi:hypothetical protein [Ralstonia sp. Ralssp135]|uniref:hypothetical protein n=1 Tax=Ralstonia sp. Ralssp135 TaxID=3243016 RepID=UPI0039AF4892